MKFEVGKLWSFESSPDHIYHITGKEGNKFIFNGITPYNNKYCMTERSVQTIAKTVDVTNNLIKILFGLDTTNQT